jgi:hypothetical protein
MCGTGDGHMCKLASFSDAWGLPHVLRACDREGLTDMKALLRKFPPPLYPKPGYGIACIAQCQFTQQWVRRALDDVAGIMCLRPGR